MKKLYIKLSFSIVMVLGFILITKAQEIEENLTPTKEIMIGVWKVDVLSQKGNIKNESQLNLSDKNEREQEDFWYLVDSRIFALDEEFNFRISWVEEGQTQEEIGRWDFDPETRLLNLISENQTFQYKVNFLPESMIWIPQAETKELFKTLYVKAIWL